MAAWSYAAGAKADDIEEHEFKATGANWGTLRRAGATRGCRRRRELLEFIATAITSGFLKLPGTTWGYLELSGATAVGGTTRMELNSARATWKSTLKLPVPTRRAHRRRKP